MRNVCATSISYTRATCSSGSERRVSDSDALRAEQQLWRGNNCSSHSSGHSNCSTCRGAGAI